MNIPTRLATFHLWADHHGALWITTDPAGRKVSGPEAIALVEQAVREMKARLTAAD